MQLIDQDKQSIKRSVIEERKSEIDALRGDHDPLRKDHDALVNTTERENDLR